jgi:hypothetical protein
MVLKLLLVSNIELVLSRVLESLDEKNIDAIDKVDWSPVIKRINRLLGEYGYSLNDVAQEKSKWYVDDNNA